jgi:membrane fusion protein, multidrug efflux system
MKRLVMAAAFMALLIGAGVAYQTLVPDGARSQTASTPRAAPAIPVLVATVDRTSVPVTLDAVGTVQPIASVGVKSRIDGQIAEVKVRDGQYVNAGDVLFQLDSRAAEAQLRQAQAQLARDRAQLAFAQQEVKRFSPLAEKSYLSREQFEQAQSTAAGSTAAVQADQAAVENAQALLSYYTITSPMDGRLGMVTLKTGNNVKANDVSFLTINQIKPIYVTFPVSERELPAIRRAMGDGSVAVSARAEGDSEPPSQGQLAFFENAVDPASGTITLRAIFVNHDERLWPGEFVKVSVTLAVEPNALVVPQAAVQIGQDSRYVFVVKPGNVAELRRVEVSRVVDGKAVIASGLEADESVVIDGQLRLSNGSRVEIRSAQGPTKPGNPS